MICGREDYQWSVIQVYVYLKRLKAVFETITFPMEMYVLYNSDDGGLSPR